MTIERKLLSTSPSGGATDVADVFSTDVYDGNGSTLDITNDIDLAGNGGMVWVKSRNHAYNHTIWSSETTGNLVTHATDAINNAGNQPTFNSDGFTFPSSAAQWVTLNQSSKTYVAWTFRKKEKFFDVVTFTANGSSNQTISHNLGSVPAMIITKKTNGTNNWYTYHTGLNNGTNPEQYFIELDGTGGGQGANANFWNNTAPTDTQFTVGSAFNSGTYVAYIFADNSSEDAEEQMIKCGTVSGQQTPNLGWEPQFLLMKRTDGAGDWRIFDSMRGLTPAGLDDAQLRPNSAEPTGFLGALGLNSTGFFSDLNGSYIYMAIRAPMMIEPKAATEAFHVNASNGNGGTSFYSTGFDVDMAITKKLTGGVNYISTRFTGRNWLRTEGQNAEDTNGTFQFDVNNGVTKLGGGGNGNDPYVTYMWKRAKGFFDVVAYTGTNALHTINHSLGVAPELIIIKMRSGTRSWSVFNSFSASGYRRGQLEGSSSFGTDLRTYDLSNGYGMASQPTSSSFRLEAGTLMNGSGSTYISYLFATLAGISKVGSYVGNGSYQTIPCGFSAGARFILIRRRDLNSSEWFYWDSARGIVAGNDPHAYLNGSGAQVTNDDSVDPHNSGFIVNQVSATNINVSSAKYIFYAIA